MRRITAVLSTAAVVMMAAGVLAQAKPNFAGSWVRDDSAAPAAPAGGGGRGGFGGRGGLGQELTITQDATNLTIEYTGGGQNPAPVKLVYKLAGEGSNQVAGRGGTTDQKYKSAWDGSKLVVTTTQDFGGNMVESKRSFALEGGNLVVETTQPGRDGGPGTPMKTVYKKK